MRLPAYHDFDIASGWRYPVPFHLDALLADSPLTTGLAPRLGEQHLRVLSVRGFRPRPGQAYWTTLTEWALPIAGRPALSAWTRTRPRRTGAPASAVKTSQRPVLAFLYFDQLRENSSSLCICFISESIPSNSNHVSYLISQMMVIFSP